MEHGIIYKTQYNRLAIRKNHTLTKLVNVMLETRDYVGNDGVRQL